jgi:hypothetical protein
MEIFQSCRTFPPEEKYSLPIRFSVRREVWLPTSLKVIASVGIPMLLLRKWLMVKQLKHKSGWM